MWAETVSRQNSIQIFLWNMINILLMDFYLTACRELDFNPAYDLLSVLKGF